MAPAAAAGPGVREPAAMAHANQKATVTLRCGGPTAETDTVWKPCVPRESPVSRLLVESLASAIACNPCIILASFSKVELWQDVDLNAACKLQGKQQEARRTS